MDERRIFVTGATGFVGGALVRRLLDDGLDPARLRVLARDPQRARAEGLPGESIVCGDLADRRALHRATSDIDVVFHVAGAVKALSRRDFDRANADGTAALMGVLGERAPGCRVVHVSSLAAAGPSVDGSSSALPPEQTHPRSHYGASKREGELAVREFGAALSWVVVRPPIVYGPRDAATALLVRQAGAPLVPVPWRRRPLSVIHVDDLVRALVRAADAEARESFIPVEGPERTDTDGLVRAIARASGRSARLVRVPLGVAWPFAVASDAAALVMRRPSFFGIDKLRDLAADGWVCDPAPARAMLGFEPEISLDEGMARLMRATGR